MWELASRLNLQNSDEAKVPVLVAPLEETTSSVRDLLLHGPRSPQLNSRRDERASGVVHDAPFSEECFAVQHHIRQHPRLSGLQGVEGDHR